MVKKAVSDLPSPKELIMKESIKKITLSLTRETLEFFKDYGKKNKVPYQKLIRSLLDCYVQRHNGTIQN